MAGSFREAELAGWTARAASYDELFAPITGQVIAPILRALGPVDGKRVLDVCCGPGHLAAALAATGAAVDGIDFAATMVARARRNHPALRFRQADAAALPFADGTFDHVVCSFGVMHFDRPEIAVAEAFRVLRPAGRYAFTQWTMDDDVLNIVAAALAETGHRFPASPKRRRRCASAIPSNAGACWVLPASSRYATSGSRSSGRRGGRKPFST